MTGRGHEEGGSGRESRDHGEGVKRKRGVAGGGDVEGEK